MRWRLRPSGAVMLACRNRCCRWYWGLGLLLLLAALLLLADRLFPLPTPGRDAPGALLVVARDGTPMRTFPDRHHVWRHPVRLEELSPYYLEAVLQFEDRAYYWHPGVNPWALLRAAWQWLVNGRIVSGGSTLTMQVARILEPVPRTLGGKLRQIARALQLEWHYSKDEILTLYINYVPMGGVLEGVEAASRGYLGKSAKLLSHGEAALLAVLPQAPSRYRPDRHPDRARQARDKVLLRLANRWPEQALRDARTETPYGLRVHEPVMAPLLAQRLRRQHVGGGRIDTTIDAAIQQAVESLLLDRAAILPPKMSIAALVVDNATLEVLAYVGSADFFNTQRFGHVDMIQASRSPGSTLKPFLYGLALDEGLIHSESLLADVPQSFSGYQPGNFQQSFHGPVSVSEALTKSLNVPAVQVLEQLDPVRFVALLRRGGLKLDFPKGGEPNLAVILGGVGTSLERLVSAYTALARQGLAGQLRFHADAPLKQQRMLSAGAAFIIRDLLESGGPMGRAIESGAGLSRGIAWKTGTSFGFRDAWAVGVSDRHTVGVWVGRPDGTANPGFFGANVAAPLLVDIFDSLRTRPKAVRPVPPEVRQQFICWPLGITRLTTPALHCHQARLAWTLDGTAPPTFSDHFRLAGPRQFVWIDSDSGLRVMPQCVNGKKIQRTEWVRWPLMLESWLPADLRRKALPPPWHPDCHGQKGEEARLRILGARNGELFSRAGSGSPPLLQLRAQGSAGGELVWLLNGQWRSRQVANEAFELVLETAGTYDVTAMDPSSGAYGHISFSVR